MKGLTFLLEEVRFSNIRDPSLTWFTKAGSMEAPSMGMGARFKLILIISRSLKDSLLKISSLMVRLVNMTWSAKRKCPRGAAAFRAIRCTALYLSSVKEDLL